MLCDELDSSNVFIMGDYNVFSNNILYLAPRHDAQNRAWVNQLRSWYPLFYLYKLSHGSCSWFYHYVASKLHMTLPKK